MATGSARWQASFPGGRAATKLKRRDFTGGLGAFYGTPLQLLPQSMGARRL